LITADIKVGRGDKTWGDGQGKCENEWEVVYDSTGTGILTAAGKNGAAATEREE